VEEGLDREQLMSLS